MQQEVAVTVSPRTVGLASIAAGIVALVVTSIIMFTGGDGDFSPPPGYVSTTQEEQDLLNLHEAAGTLDPHPSEKAQRAILEHARVLCKTLDDKTMTVARAIEIGRREGMTNAENMTDFAVSSLCPQYER